MKKLIFVLMFGLMVIGMMREVRAYVSVGETGNGTITRIYTDTNSAYPNPFITFSGPALSGCGEDGQSLYLGEPGVTPSKLVDRMLAVAMQANTTGKAVRIRYSNGGAYEGDTGWSLCYAYAIWLQE